MSETEKLGNGGNFDGADAMREKMKAALKKGTTPQNTFTAKLNGNKPQTRNKQRQAEFIKEFSALCAKYGIADQMSFIAFVKDSISKIL